MLVVSQYHIFESYKTNIYRVRKGFLIYKEMRKYLTIYIYEEAVSHI